MSIIAIDLKVPRRGSVATERKGLLTEVARRRYTKVFQVFVDDILDGPNTILKSPGVPKLGETYFLGNDSDLLATCISVNCEPTEHPMVFTLTSEYDTSRVVDLNFDNPLNIPPEISYTFQTYQRPFTRDVTGVPVLNTSGEHFDPPYEIEDSRPTIVINRNEPFFDSAAAELYQDACNADIWNARNIYSAKILNIGAQRIADMGTKYWRVTYEIQIRRDTYALPLLDQGFRYKIVRNGIESLTLFRDLIDNAPLGNPTLLNGRGQNRNVGRATLLNPIDPDGNTMTISGDAIKFPPLADGGVTPQPHGFFEVRIDQEVVQVRAAVGSLWAIQRGWAGTTPAAHGTSAVVTLEPYFLRFLPFKALPFAALNLPVF